MTSHGSHTPPPGWVGGFLEKHPECRYPQADLGSLKFTGNLEHIDKLKRQQKVLWPEFSWETKPGDKSSRCYQMFAPDISRLGYDNSGEVWSIICPQQGVVIDNIGALNVEVTVTGTRGWANEITPWVDGKNQECAADLMVEGTIWFSPSAHQNRVVAWAWDHFANESLPFPSKKDQAIKVTTHAVGVDQKWFSLRKGQTDRFESPEFAKHWRDGAWAVGNLSVEIGPIKKTGYEKVDSFNQQVLDIFNEASGNMLLLDNVLTWDVWFDTPELVDQSEWSKHAEKWRHSIDVDHGKSPTGGVSTKAKFFDGTEFHPTVSKAKEFIDFVKLLTDL